MLNLLTVDIMGTTPVEMIVNGKGNEMYPALHTVQDEENEC